ncbi:MAG: type II secretion system protein GspG [Candidatus Aminicenantes bacterium]|nr:MAG: type II secretion system protein GspG [Candidatus Aminicenantes bacterium]
MRKTKIFLVLSAIVGTAILLFTLAQCSSERGFKGEYIKPAEKTSFDEVTSQLNPGGSFYLYVSTEKLVKGVEELVNKLRKIIEARLSKSPEESKQGLVIFDFIHGLLKNSGLMEISGIGVSSVPLGEQLNHSKVVVHHYKDKGKGLIWQLTAGTPHELTQLGMLPADTVMAGYGDFKLSVLWQWIKKQAEASNLPEVKKGILSVEPILQMQGIRLDQLLDSLAGMGYVISLDSSTMRTIPLGKIAVEFPEPALAIIFSVKDDYIFNLLQTRLPMAQKVEEKDIKKLKIPVPPMPITVEPVIVQKDNMLILASNNKILDAMFAAKSKGNGLTATEEFKKLSAHIPGKGNSFRFVSSRFVQTFLDIQKKIVESAKGSQGEDAPGKEIFDLFPLKIATYGVMQHTPKGTVYTFNHTMSLQSFMLLPAAVVPGIIAAIAIPNYLTALQKGKQKATMVDMKTISNAIESYITDNDKAPEGKTLAEIKDQLQPFYIKVLPLEDAWGNEFHYYHGTGDKKAVYAIGSGGRDGIFNGWDQTGFYVLTEIKHFGNDIIIANGRFTYGPKVK